MPGRIGDNDPMEQQRHSGGSAATLRWPVLGMLGAAAFVWAAQVGVAHAGLRGGPGRQGFSALTPEPVPGAMAFAAAADTPEQDSPTYHPNCWAGQLRPTGSIAVADWSGRATVIGIGGLHGP